MPKSFRRIVTANDANGRSEIYLDGPATTELATVMTEMWVTDAGTHNHAERVDQALKSKRLEPPPAARCSASFGFRRRRPSPE